MKRGEFATHPSVIGWEMWVTLGLSLRCKLRLVLKLSTIAQIRADSVQNWKRERVCGGHSVKWAESNFRKCLSHCNHFSGNLRHSPSRLCFNIRFASLTLRIKNQPDSQVTRGTRDSQLSVWNRWSLISCQLWAVEGYIAVRNFLCTCLKEFWLTLRIPSGQMQPDFIWPLSNSGMCLLIQRVRHLCMQICFCVLCDGAQEKSSSLAENTAPSWDVRSQIPPSSCFQSRLATVMVSSHWCLHTCLDFSRKNCNFSHKCEHTSKLSHKCHWLCMCHFSAEKLVINKVLVFLAARKISSSVNTP